jgi:hypothetical protein
MRRKGRGQGPPTMTNGAGIPRMTGIALSGERDRYLGTQIYDAS